MGAELSEAYRRLGESGQRKHHNFDGQGLGVGSGRTFNLASRRATMPVERHRFARLAGESELRLRLLQQPISLSLAEKVVDFSLATASATLDCGRRVPAGREVGIYGPMRIATATAPRTPNHSGTRRLALLAGRWARGLASRFSSSPSPRRTRQRNRQSVTTTITLPDAVSRDDCWGERLFRSCSTALTGEF
jgi:hypothetical protein